MVIVSAAIHSRPNRSLGLQRLQQPDDPKALSPTTRAERGADRRESASGNETDIKGAERKVGRIVALLDGQGTARKYQHEAAAKKDLQTRTRPLQESRHPLLVGSAGFARFCVSSCQHEPSRNMFEGLAQVHEHTLRTWVVGFGSKEFRVIFCHSPGASI